MEYIKSLLSCSCINTDPTDNMQIIAETTTNNTSNKNKRSINASLNQPQTSTQETEKIKIQQSEEIEKLQKEIKYLKQTINQKENIINEQRNKMGELQQMNQNSKIFKSKGLDNIGATCYMNATLQCLSNTKKIRDYFLNKYNNAPNNLMANEFNKLIINLFNEYDRKNKNTTK